MKLNDMPEVILMKKTMEIFIEKLDRRQVRIVQSQLDILKKRLEHFKRVFKNYHKEDPIYLCHWTTGSECYTRSETITLNPYTFSDCKYGEDFYIYKNVIHNAFEGTINAVRKNLELNFTNNSYDGIVKKLNNKYKTRVDVRSFRLMMFTLLVRLLSKQIMIETKK